jgi:hypothetical protein
MKLQTKREAIKAKKEFLDKGKSVNIYKFAEKRKYQYFVGTWWEWLSKIS